MILYVTPIEWRRVAPSAACRVQGADRIPPISARGLCRVYRELRQVGGDRGRRGTQVPPAQARAFVARLIQIGWIAGFAEGVDSARLVEVPRWRMIDDREMAALG